MLTFWGWYTVVIVPVFLLLIIVLATHSHVSFQQLSTGTVQQYMCSPITLLCTNLIWFNHYEYVKGRFLSASQIFGMKFHSAVRTTWYLDFFSLTKKNKITFNYQRKRRLWVLIEWLVGSLWNTIVPLLLVFDTWLVINSGYFNFNTTIRIFL